MDYLHDLTIGAFAKLLDFSENVLRNLKILIQILEGNLKQTSGILILFLFYLTPFPHLGLIRHFCHQGMFCVLALLVTVIFKREHIYII